MAEILRLILTSLIEAYVKSATCEQKSQLRTTFMRFVFATQYAALFCQPGNCSLPLSKFLHEELNNLLDNRESQGYVAINRNILTGD